MTIESLTGDAARRGGALRLVNAPYGDDLPECVRLWLLAADAEGLTGLLPVKTLGFETAKDCARLRAALETFAGPPEAEACAARALHLLERFWAGEGAELPELSPALGGTPFERRVWAAARTLAPGELVSYGELARLVGSPGAAQAAGNALRRNPVLLVIPCHRVVPASTLRIGGLRRVGGFAGAMTGPLTELKRRMLAYEAGLAAD